MCSESTDASFAKMVRSCHLITPIKGLTVAMFHMLLVNLYLIKNLYNFFNLFLKPIPQILLIKLSDVDSDILG